MIKIKIQNFVNKKVIPLSKEEKSKCLNFGQSLLLDLLGKNMYQQENQEKTLMLHFWHYSC
jgi:hypothetical protein